MRFGVCKGFDWMEKAAKAGFDFIEPTIGSIAPSVSDAEMDEMLSMAAASPVKPEAFNCFIPGSLKITGPEADIEALSDYVSAVLPRAAAAGAQIVVFGSGGARQVPDGFGREAALGQIEEFLKAVNPLAAENGITIVIEPLKSGDCNIINRVAESCAMAGKLGLSNVKALADLYHMGQDGEPVENIVNTGGLLCHIHIAYPVTRKCPLPDDGFDYQPFFRSLRKAGYDGRVSLECSWADFESEAPVSLNYLREQWRKTGRGEEGQ